MAAASPRRSPRTVPHKRRQGRVHALSLVYAFDQKHFHDDERLDIEDEPADLSNHARQTGRELFNNFRQERSAVDAIIDKRLTNWTLGRMAVIDRSLLRLGTYELLFCGEVPVKVIINEYIELAKIYGSDGKTAKLINGVLDRVAKDHRRGQPIGEGAPS